MAAQLAIVAYRCLVAGLPTDSVDIQVRWFSDGDTEEIRRFIMSEPATSYKNCYDEVVYWEFSCILAIAPFEPQASGDEVVGFIASTKELSELG